MRRVISKYNCWNWGPSRVVLWYWTPPVQLDRRFIAYTSLCSVHDMVHTFERHSTIALRQTAVVFSSRLSAAGLCA